MMPVFSRGSKSQAEQIELLLRHGWKEEQSREYGKNSDNALYLWRWRQPKTGALFTLKGAFELIQNQRLESSRIKRKTKC